MSVRITWYLLYVSAKWYFLVYYGGRGAHALELEGPAQPWVASSSVGDMVQDSVQFFALMHVGIKHIFDILLMGWLYFFFFFLLIKVGRKKG